jgi:hypothetical protein
MRFSMIPPIRSYLRSLDEVVAYHATTLRLHQNLGAGCPWPQGTTLVFPVDPTGRHAPAAAIAGRADVIVTRKLWDFRADTVAH